MAEGFRSILAIPLGLALGASGPAPTPPNTSFGFGISSDVQHVGDERWQGVREAREAARRIMDEKPVTKAQRKATAKRAIEAVAVVEKEVAKLRSTPLPVTPQVDFGGIIGQLENLQASIFYWIEADMHARHLEEMARRWLLIEEALRIELLLEEELMIVFALTL